MENIIYCSWSFIIYIYNEIHGNLLPGSKLCIWVRLGRLA